MTAAEEPDLHIFGHDLLNAYRQWPVKSPEHSTTVLATEHGITLWMHHAMCFGAAASVWNFNRAADALQQVLRTTLWLLVGHYVDDFNGVEFAELAMNGFDAFAELFALLGLMTKASKAQPPSRGHIIQGVWMELHPDGVSLAPTEKRLAKLDLMISQALELDELVPATAQKLAGKLSFLTQAVFGSLGKAAISPIYHRAAETDRRASDSLSTGLRSALLALRGILANVKPRFMWHSPQAEFSAVLYADAFFVTDGNRHKAGHVPSTASTSPHSRSDNGWGFVLRIGQLVYYDMGTVSEEHLEAFTTRKAFIYALEILAQVIAATAFGGRLPAMWIAFIDNTAGQAALLKGYGRDPAVNGVLAAFWATAARHDWRPAFERVVSKANISDAVSRRDLDRARRDGWTRVHTPSEDIVGVLAKAAQDLQYACHGAADDLVGISEHWSPLLSRHQVGEGVRRSACRAPPLT